MNVKPINSVKMTPFDYPAGSILFDVRYYKMPTECFEVVFYNPLTRELELKYEPAIVDIWFLKPEERTNKYQISQVEIDRCYQFNCKPSQISKVIAQEIGGEWQKLYEDMIADEYPSNEISKKMCECPWVFKADFEPAAYFRLKWIKQYGKSIDLSHVSPAFFDIELDVIDRNVDPGNYTSAPQPINAITLIIPHVKIAAVFILGPRPKHLIHEKFYPLLEKQMSDYLWIKSHKEEFKHELVYDDEDNVKFMTDFDIRLHMFEFDQEISMIKTLFDYVAKYRPWFLMAWNAPFDCNYIWKRIEHLGYDPKDIMIPREFKTKKIMFHEDTNSKKVIKTSRDWFDLSSYCVMLCQMRNFAAIRKSQQERRSYGLDVIAREVAGIGKTAHFDKRLAYTNLKEFIKYNFRDVVAQYATELATQDCKTLVSRSYMFGTEYSKCFQETHIVRNSKELSYEKKSRMIQACRLLIDRTIDGAFQGAFVADPEKNAKTGLVLNAKFVNNIIYGSLDADAESYYPSTKMALNLDPMSLLFKCHINNQNFHNGTSHNRSMNQEYIWYDSDKNPHDVDMSGPLFNSFKNGNMLSVMSNWFNCPTVTEVFKFLDGVFG